MGREMTQVERAEKTSGRGGGGEGQISEGSVGQEDKGFKSGGGGGGGGWAARRTPKSDVRKIIADVEATSWRLRAKLFESGSLQQRIG